MVNHAPHMLHKVKNGLSQSSCESVVVDDDTDGGACLHDDCFLLTFWKNSCLHCSIVVSDLGLVALSIHTLRSS